MFDDKTSHIKCQENFIYQRNGMGDVVQKYQKYQKHIDTFYRLEEELKEDGQRRKVAEVRGRIAYLLSREMGIPMAEISRKLGVGTSVIAMAIWKKEEIA